MRTSRMLALAGGMAALVSTGMADAITLPDNSSCNNTAANGCFKISNTNTGSAARAVIGAASGSGAGVTGTSATSGSGVAGTSASGPGVTGTSTTGSGVSGTATSTSGTGHGVAGTTSGNGAGVSGAASGASIVGFVSKNAAGVLGTSSRGYGVYGETTGDGNTLSGVLGVSNKPFSFGVMGVYRGGDNQMAGVVGKAVVPNGSQTEFQDTGVGVLGMSGGAGVRGQCLVNASNPGGSGQGPGVDGFSDLGIGVSGTSGATAGSCSYPGTCASFNIAVGVRGESLASSAGTGVFGVIPASADGNSAAVRGDAGSGLGNGVWGVSGAGIGVIGYSTSGTGVYAANNVTDNSAAAVAAYPGSTSALAFYGAGGIELVGSFAQKAGGGSWSAPSDQRIKKDVKDLDRGLAELMRVRPVRFKYNGLAGTDDDGKEYVGVIAQELEKVLPSMVSTKKAKLHKSDGKDSDIEIVDPSAFTFMLINAVKQQQATIQAQEARLAALERRGSPPAASMIPGGLGGWAALGLLPIGLIIGRGRGRRWRQRVRPPGDGPQ